MFNRFGISVTATSTPAVSVKELKEQLNIDGDDGLLTDYIFAATDQLEHDTARSFINKTHTLKLDKFPCYEVMTHGDIYLPVAPVSSITSIAYIDNNGDSQTWSSSNYDVDTTSEPARISPAYNVSYPTARDINNAVTITLVAGYGATPATVPARAKQIIKLLVGEYWMHREIGCMSEEAEKSYMSMAERLKWNFYG